MHGEGFEIGCRSVGPGARFPQQWQPHRTMRLFCCKASFSFQVCKRHRCAHIDGISVAAKPEERPGQQRRLRKRRKVGEKGRSI